jgi:FkbM family methyltransferase
VSGDQLYVNNLYFPKTTKSINLFRKAKNRLFPAPINKYEKKSYSQSGEDLIVKYIFDSIGISQPTYLDIGTHHPYYLNNTYLFYVNGSTGINIEPDIDLFEVIVKERINDVNLNLGIGIKSGEMPFYKMSTTTLNTFSHEEAKRYEEKGFTIIEEMNLPVVDINNVILKYSNNICPDFLSIDVEGLDLIIIKSIDFNKHFPIVICVETISFSENGNGIKDCNFEQFLSEKGYILYADTNINSIFVRKDKWVRS